ncbi:MAG: tRNA (adenosine(37)-N6)-threonylcarbamoyltransferase complex ATPase subunit type 1 TsaE [Desulfovibrionaceae bacterium]
MSQIITTNSVKETIKLAKILASIVERERIYWVELIGGYGVGKTTFTRAFVEFFDGSDNAEISSPSFSLYNVYPTIPRCIHMDLYRLQEGFVLGEEMEELFEEEGIFIIEWADLLPKNLNIMRKIRILFSLESEKKRNILIDIKCAESVLLEEIVEKML